MKTLLHIPHSSRHIPADVRDQFLLSDADLERELLAMTDAHTDALFGGLVRDSIDVVFPVSRLVLDPERFAEDEDEPMSRIGMGVVYTKTSDGRPLRRAISIAERHRLLDTWYRPHHERLTAAARKCLNDCGECLLVDCHSFPSVPLPYESDQDLARPDVCIGVDRSHTPERLLQELENLFRNVGWSVAVDRPFAGSMVPAALYGIEPRLRSVMIEVNRRLYMDEATGERRKSFDPVRRALVDVLEEVVRFPAA